MEEGERGSRAHRQDCGDSTLGLLREDCPHFEDGWACGEVLVERAIIQVESPAQLASIHLLWDTDWQACI